MAKWEELKQIQIIGNAHSDSALLNELHNFIIDPNNKMSERCEAMDYVSHMVMGVKDEKMAMPQDVMAYTKEFK